MQVNVISGGDAAFDALVYKPPSQEVLNYLSTGIEHTKNIFSGLGEVGQSFLSHVTTHHDNHTNSSVLNAAKLLVHSAGSHMNNEVISVLAEDQLINANFIMQQFIMAHPNVNFLNQDNMCNGFVETYVDKEQGVYGTERNDYRSVMDGVLQNINLEKDDEDDDLLCIRHYSSSGDDELDILDKLAVLETWDNVDNMLIEGIDPTDPHGGLL